MKTDVAILAGGCFWGVQELIRKLNGVVSTEVGYTGGRNDNPTYQHHPGHAEAVKVVYSPEKPLQPAEDTGEKTAGRRSLPGSGACVPSVAGLLLASEVVKDLCRFAP